MDHTETVILTNATNMLMSAACNFSQAGTITKITCSIQLIIGFYDEENQNSGLAKNSISPVFLLLPYGQSAQRG